MSMLVEVTEAAIALAEMQTQLEDLPTAEENVVVETGKAASCSKEDGCGDK